LGDRGKNAENRAGTVDTNIKGDGRGREKGGSTIDSTE
jgi:hypothetical protein